MIRCSRCGLELTAPLVEVHGDFEPVFEEWRESVPAGRFWPNTDFRGETVVTVNTDDVVGMVADLSNTMGCCGNSKHAITHRCSRCLSPVGTVIDDCWTGLYFYFDSSAVATGDAATALEAVHPEDPVAAATIWRRGSLLWFVASCSRGKLRRWAPDTLVLRNANVDLQHVTESVIKALDRSRLDPEDFDARALWKRLPGLAGVPDHSQFMRGTVAVEVAQTWAGIVVTPTRNDGPDGGFVQLPEAEERIDARVSQIDTGALSAAIHAALQRSYITQAAT